MLTGESGSGKSWLASTSIRRVPEWTTHVSVEAASLMEPADFLQSLLAKLALDPIGAESPGSALVRIEHYLAETHADDRRIVLICDDLQLATPDVLDLVRTFCARLGSASGFDQVLLVGQTSLRRDLGARRWTSLDSRIGERIHLGPIDADEAEILLKSTRPDVDWSDREIEQIHRETLGNARKILMLARKYLTGCSTSEKVLESNGQHRVVGRVPLDSRMDAGVDEIATPQVEVQPWLPGRPVVQNGDNVIEVGWDLVPGDASAPSWTTPADLERLAAGLQTPSQIQPPGGQELESTPIVDPYAALQAAIERERAEYGTSPAANKDIELGDDNEESAVQGVTWPDSPHPFEPFGDLFASTAAPNGTPSEQPEI